MKTDQTPNPLFTLTHHAWLASEFRDILNDFPHATDRQIIIAVIGSFAGSLMCDDPNFNPALWYKSIMQPVEPTTGLPGDLEDQS